MPHGDHDGDAPKPLRVVIYDATDVVSASRPGLSPVWALGAKLYHRLGRSTHTVAATGLDQVLSWFSALPPHARVADVQWWSHGKWGNAQLGGQHLDERALLRGSPYAAGIDALVRRMAPSSLFWLRTCESFGASAGQRFARALADRMDCRVAGHTYVIGLWQSGLHSLSPGQHAHWSAEEGLVDGTAQQPKRARMSMPLSPHTIHCLKSSIPEGW